MRGSGCNHFQVCESWTRSWNCTWSKFWHVLIRGMFTSWLSIVLSNQSESSKKVATISFIRVALEKPCPLQIMEIIATSNKFPWYFQPFGHFHGMEICWKSTSILLDTSMVEVEISMIWRGHDFSSLEPLDSRVSTHKIKRFSLRRSLVTEESDSDSDEEQETSDKHDLMMAADKVWVYSNLLTTFSHPQDILNENELTQLESPDLGYFGAILHFWCKSAHRSVSQLCPDLDQIIRLEAIFMWVSYALT